MQGRAYAAASARRAAMIADTGSSRWPVPDFLVRMFMAMTKARDHKGRAEWCMKQLREKTTPSVKDIRWVMKVYRWRHPGKRDGCACCGRARPYFAVKHEDEYCSTECARWHSAAKRGEHPSRGTSLPHLIGGRLRGMDS